MAELVEIPEVIATLERVRLRTWVPGDVEWYANLVADRKVMRFIADGATRDRSTAAQEIARFREEQARRGWSRWVVERTGDRAKVGYVGFSLRNGVADWGGRCFQRFWGSELTILAQIAALEAGLIGLGISEAVAVTDIENRRAWRGNLRFGWSDPSPVLRFGRAHVLQTIRRDEFIESGQAEGNLALAERLSFRGRAVASA